MQKCLLLQITFAILSGCSAGTNKETETEIANKIRDLIPKAASCSISQLENITSESKLKDFDNHTLTLLFMFLEPTKGDRKESDLQIITDSPRPKDLAEAISKSKEKGYGTVIQPDYIKEFSCKIKGDKAGGAISFEAEKLYKGKVEYSATRKDNQWKITEFRLPKMKLKVTLNEQNQWKKHSIE